MFSVSNENQKSLNTKKKYDEAFLRELKSF